MFHDGASARYYDQMRRRRRWSLNGRNGLQGYSAYLAGAGDDIGSLVGATTAAYESDSSPGASASRVIFIGVATGVLTFLVNRLLGKVLG
jgi:hypothetical protein